MVCNPSLASRGDRPILDPREGTEIREKTNHRSGDSRFMQSQEKKQPGKVRGRFSSSLPYTFSFYLKCATILLLFLFSIIIVACSGSAANNSTANASNLEQGPQPTITIRIGSYNATPTPTLPPDWCGAWATQTSVSSDATSVGIDAKFTKNVNGNPQGIDGATARIDLSWPDGTPFTQTVQTTPDGLAVFTVPVENNDMVMNKLILAQVTFNKDGLSCSVSADRQAFFVVVAPTPTPTPTPDPNNNNGN